MRANKHLHRLALIVRKEDPIVKTKIHIPSGELHPILSIKRQGEDVSLVQNHSTWKELLLPDLVL